MALLVIVLLGVIILGQFALIWGLINRLLLQARLPKIDVPTPVSSNFQPLEQPERPKNKLFSVRVQG